MSGQYALVENGLVLNILLGLPSPNWTPPTGETVVAIPPGESVSVGYLYNNGTFQKPAVVRPPLSLAQQAAEALSAGVTIACASTPALNGTYPVDSGAQMLIMAETVSIVDNGTFTNGRSTVEDWVDIAGNPHTFTVPEFKVFATFSAAYVSALLKIVRTNNGTLPSSTVTIP